MYPLVSPSPPPAMCISVIAGSVKCASCDEPTDRRTFLTNGLKGSVVVTAAGLVGDRADGSPEQHDERAASSIRRVVTGTRLSARGFTVNGAVDPLGVDPDDCSFAWMLTSPDRNARQRGYRIRVQRDDPGLRSLVWDSGAVPSARQAFIAYGGTTLDGDATYRWSLQVQDPSGNWSAPIAGGPFPHLSAPRRLDGPVAASGGFIGSAQPSDLRADSGHASAAAR